MWSLSILLVPLVYICLINILSRVITLYASKYIDISVLHPLYWLIPLATYWIEILFWDGLFTFMHSLALLSIVFWTLLLWYVHIKTVWFSSRLLYSIALGIFLAIWLWISSFLLWYSVRDWLSPRWVFFVIQSTILVFSGILYMSTKEKLEVSNSDVRILFWISFFKMIGEISILYSYGLIPVSTSLSIKRSGILFSLFLGKRYFWEQNILYKACATICILFW